jgi:hypothetical protein
MPPKHPLFRSIPPKDVVLEVLGTLGLHVGQVWTRTDLQIQDAADIIGVLEPYYFTCKSTDLFSNLNEKRLITILRQCLKVHGFQLKGRETTRNGRKVVNYIIHKEETHELDEPIVVSFN